MNISQHTKPFTGTIKGTPRAAVTYRSARRAAGKIKARHEAALATVLTRRQKSEWTFVEVPIQRPSWRPKHRNAFPHQSDREMARRVRQMAAKS